MDSREIEHRKCELMAKVKIINFEGKQTPVLPIYCLFAGNTFKVMSVDKSEIQKLKKAYEENLELGHYWIDKYEIHI